IIIIVSQLIGGGEATRRTYLCQRFCSSFGLMEFELRYARQEATVHPDHVVFDLSGHKVSMPCPGRRGANAA
ncbi:MAG: hypothetical protein OXQ89_15190, partial [Rhodospirillaceae bacterium]|nr:hypothetical protein [Rhodospirillaceae bacterium]